MMSVYSPVRAASLVLGAFLLLGCGPSAIADADSDARRMMVSATGTVSGAPDLANINVGVLTEGETAEEALATNNKSMRALIDTLKSAGLNEKDIQTSRFDVSPQYAKSAGSYNARGRITGYQVTNQVRIVVRDLEALGSILDRVTKAGANQMYGITFGFADPQPLLDKAMENAVKEAMRKADLYASAANVKLGKLVLLQETGQARPEVMGMRTKAMAMDSVPIAAGESLVSAGVTLTFEIE